ncbi:MAG: hypothetical protein HGN29_11220 [Asgard group archaeon]|nr:hypothetical protein [Asgard group archaeon]
MAEHYPPYVDGDVLPMHFYEAVQKGIAKDFEIIAGTNENEYPYIIPVYFFITK